MTISITKIVAEVTYDDDWQFTNQLLCNYKKCVKLKPAYKYT